MADEIGEIRARINIVDLVGQTVALKRSGNRYQGLCPFHQDRNPSFSVSPETGRYRCWSCGEKGDIFNWVMKTRNVEFVEALRILAEQAGVTLKTQKPEDRSIRMSQRAAMDASQKFFREQLAKSKEAKAYCTSRNLSQDVLDKWEIGYAPDEGQALAINLRKQGFRLAECKQLFLVDGDEEQGYWDKFRGRLIFPIRDERGDLVAFGGRALGDAQPKYINSGETPLYKKRNVLYGMNVAKESMRDKKMAVLTEGYMDVIACHTAGVKTAVASLGTSLTEDHAKLLKRWCESVTVLYDSDKAGQNAAAKSIEILSKEGLRVRIALVPEGKDPDTLLKSAGPAAVQKAAEAGLTPLEYRIHMIEKNHPPESEEFWSEAIAAIAAESSEMERLKFVEDLAPRYPKIHDAQAARGALLRQVQKRQVGAPAVTQNEQAAVHTSQERSGARSMISPEVAVFRAIMDEEYRQLTWPLLSEEDFFVTGVARKLAHEVAKSFPEGMPEGPVRQWIEQLELDIAKDVLVSVEQDPRVSFLTPEYVADSVERLRQKGLQREIEALKKAEGDERDREIYERLKREKGG